MNDKQINVFLSLKKFSLQLEPLFISFYQASFYVFNTLEHIPSFWGCKGKKYNFNNKPLFQNFFKKFDWQKSFGISKQTPFMFLNDGILELC